MVLQPLTICGRERAVFCQYQRGATLPKLNESLG